MWRTRSVRILRPGQRPGHAWAMPCAIAQNASTAPGRARRAFPWTGSTPYSPGCRCVADQPWATVAESCELVLALLAAGRRRQASELFSWLHQHRAEDGSYWTGYQFSERVLWPDERPTWTSAAILLAADALAEATPAHRLFTHVEMPEGSSEAERRHGERLLRQG